MKFQNNPQHLRVLPNELLGTRLGALLGLTVPACDVVEVTPWLIERTPELEMDFGARRERCRARSALRLAAGGRTDARATWPIICPRNS